MRRRTFVAVVGCAGAGVLSGCSEYLIRDENIIDQDNRIVKENRHFWWEFELSSSADLTLSTAVREGPLLDVLVMTIDEFRSYQSDERHRYLIISQHDTVGETTSQTVSSGEYVLLIENHHIARSPTDRDARVDVTLHADY